MSREEADKALKDAIESVVGMQWAEAIPSSGVLYHYTSAEGLSGILGSRGLWMTDIRYMNDLSELQYATERLKSRLDARLELSGNTEIGKEFIEACLRNTGSLGNSVALFSVSFCEESNLLSQWRAYRGQGGGYALGFDCVHLLRLLDKPCVLRKVIYDQSVQDRLLDDAIDVFMHLEDQLQIRAPLDVDGRRAIADIATAFSNSSLQLLFSIKHPGFSEEREWRLVYSESSHPRYSRSATVPTIRTYDGNIIPYVILSFDLAIKASKDDTLGIRFPIVEVKVGPTINAELNRYSISRALLGIAPDVEHYITDSGIPLRWL